MPVYLQYYFWLVLVSLGCFLLERVAPWRREQKAFRRGILQDLFGSPAEHWKKGPSICRSMR